MTQTTDKLQLAAEFVNSTASHIFLTGKAGTGKTTFLHQLAQATHKNYLIVAPTGIAALNAHGVTIHSQFQFPFGAFLPDTVQFSEVPKASFFGRSELASRHALNKRRREVLRNIDLLIIDEVSMLRADLLDAIDYRLRSARGNYRQPFGGVQLLMIGDLFQLPPIVKNEEWNYLSRFYPSIHFFESRALKESGYAYIELDKIFRQQDDTFIRILNNLRNNECTAEDLKQLNAYYQPDRQREDGLITLTTHNYRADRINREELDRLDGPSHFFQATIDGDFPPSLFPLDESLELRVGAQVIFVRNDSEGGQFFNGKLARVKELTEDGVCVDMEDQEDFWVPRQEWENIRYILDEKSKELQEEVIGTFVQFPLRLAWAITVHKSQGLTFDRAIIDVGKAFAPGQVYVALSRLRSLDGLILHTPVSSSVISCDEDVMRYSRQHDDPDLRARLNTERRAYLEKLVQETFDFSAIEKQMEYSRKKMAGKLEFEDGEMREALPQLQHKLQDHNGHTRKFRRQLSGLIQSEDEKVFTDRLRKGSDFYLDFLYGRLYELHVHLQEVKMLKRTKGYQNLLDELDQFFMRQIALIQRVQTLSIAVLRDEQPENEASWQDKREARRKKVLAEAQQYVQDHPKNLKNKTGRKQKPKGATYQITYELVGEGLSAEEIARKRELSLSTIQGHMARGIEAGELQLSALMEENKRQEIDSLLKQHSDGLKEAYAAAAGKFSYAELRMVRAHQKLSAAADSED